MTKEEFYDKNIDPLMAQIIGLCKEAEIPLFAAFTLDWREDDQGFVRCTTAILHEEWGIPDGMLENLRRLLPRS